MNYKLIALDVDGTLLNDNYQISDKTKQIIRRVHEEGSQIVLCTGRGPASTLPILDELGLEGTVITHNGAATVHSDSSGKQLLHQYPFSLDDIQSMLQYVRSENIHFDVNTPFDMYIEKLEEYEKQMYKKFLIDPQIVANVTDLLLPIVKFTLFGQPEVLDRVQQVWEEQKLYGSLRMIRSGDLFIDLMNPLANKGNALKDLAESWNIDAKHVMAVGNYYNDIEMMSYAGLGLAVANSPDGVKAAADAVIASNNDDGVYEAIVKYCL
ncbi:Cof-type HAD-IIB family hydrolase [Paenibacillus eucommiae]|uniref:Cof subfamily protein (Haloacid dehalogenase superfamily) n=1 Tax=Paenibacillus eucommiae TaxID=1355755 RepID=A0ABS4INU2_9BACL|nr:Cof-type HAD-IIB family hydrolase [Paenibacillus eucommiae]MBP1989227.1 Cof subfamily protein (haloacid dehalogenase superfamily) [Paenibacillus eucommiae]